MKKVFLMGRSEAGKTSLTQALKGEELHYHKTQYTNSNEDTIDSPGEYAESKHFSVGLACFSFEADVVAIVQAADEPFNLFSDGSRCFLLRPLIGIITKVDSPYANLPMVRQWMQNMGCEHIFEVNNVTREGKINNRIQKKQTWQNVCSAIWSKQRESNPHPKLGKLVY